MILLDKEVALSYRMRSGIQMFSKSFRHKEVHEIVSHVVVTSKEFDNLMKRMNICVHIPIAATVRPLGWQFWFCLLNLNPTHIISFSDTGQPTIAHTLQMS